MKDRAQGELKDGSQRGRLSGPWETFRSSLPGKRLSTRLGRGQKEKDLLEEGKCQCTAFLLFSFSVGD